jgi:N-acetylglutamate synthase-like GNAT family acetyltransferase
MNTSIRKARIDDIPDIVLVWTEFMQFLINCNPDYRRNRDGESAFGQLLKRTIDDPNSLIIVYEANGTILGFI